MNKKEVKKKLEKMMAAVIDVPADLAAKIALITTKIENNWKDESSYDYTKNHNLGLWAWEFLRRNEVYKTLYNENQFLLNNPWRLAYYYPPDVIPPSNMIYFYNKEFYSYYDDTDLDESSDIKESALTLTMENLKDKKIINVKNPSYDKRNVFPKRISLENCKEGIIQISKSNFLARIDSDKPLKPQLKNIEKSYLSLKEKNKKTSKKRVCLTKHKANLWKLYLRCLDAEEMGVRRNLASSILKISPEKYSETLKQAKKTRDTTVFDIIDCSENLI